MLDRNSPQRWLVTGFGSIGRRHYANLRAKGFSDVAVVDVSGEARATASKLKEPPAFIGSDFSEGLSWGPDAVIVATPTACHIQEALAAAEAGCDLFIEKPLSHTLENLDMLAEKAQAKQLVTLVGCNQRFHPAVAALKAIMEAGELGTILSARLEVGSYLPSWRPGTDYRHSYSSSKALGGGIILDAIHEIDLAAWLFGFPEEVFALARDGDTLGIETESLAEVLFHYEGGLIVSLHLDYVQRWRQRRIEIIGERGSAVLDRRTHALQHLKEPKTEPETVWHDQGYDPNAMYANELDYFIDRVRRRAAADSDVRWATAVTALALKVKQSAEEGKPLKYAAEPAWLS